MRRSHVDEARTTRRVDAVHVHVRRRASFRSSNGVATRMKRRGNARDGMDEQHKMHPWHGKETTLDDDDDETIPSPCSKPRRFAIDNGKRDDEMHTAKLFVCMHHWSWHKRFGGRTHPLSHESQAPCRIGHLPSHATIRCMTWLMCLDARRVRLHERPFTLLLGGGRCSCGTIRSRVTCTRIHMMVQTHCRILPSMYGMHRTRTVCAKEMNTYQRMERKELLHDRRRWVDPTKNRGFHANMASTCLESSNSTGMVQTVALVGSLVSPT